MHLFQYDGRGESQMAGRESQTYGLRIYLDTGDLSTAEYSYDFRWMRASSETHSAMARSCAR